jgi:hypothetical protein
MCVKQGKKSQMAETSRAGESLITPLDSPGEDPHIRVR